MTDEQSDLPCEWCGKTLAEHLDARAPDAPVPRMPCAGLKAFFFAKLGTTEGWRPTREHVENALAPFEELSPTAASWRLHVLMHEVHALREALEVRTVERDGASERARMILEHKNLFSAAVARVKALPASWRNHYSDRVADAVASGCADDLEEALRGDDES